MNKTLTKLMLDIVLTVLFIALIYPKETGFAFHEITGLASSALVIFHIVLNWSWVKSVTCNLFNSKLKSKTKLFYLLNTFSFVASAIVIITGIQISVVLFPGQDTTSHNLVWLHKWLSYTCLGLFGLHLALHWSFFAHTVPRMFKKPNRPSFGKVALNLGALILTLGLLTSQLGFNLNNESLNPSNQHKTVRNEDTAVLNKTQSSDNNPPLNSSVYAPPAGDSKPTAVKGHAKSSENNKISSSKTTGSDTGVSSAPNTSSTSQPALTQYLNNLFCDGCHKHCSLLSPQCNIGVDQAAAARQKYTATYGANTLN